MKINKLFNISIIKSIKNVETLVRDKKIEKHDCNVCFETKDCVQCLKCKNCFVCQDCLLSMCENGYTVNVLIADNRPRSLTRKSKIVPITTENVIISNKNRLQLVGMFTHQDDLEMRDLVLLHYNP